MGVRRGVGVLTRLSSRPRRRRFLLFRDARTAPGFRVISSIDEPIWTRPPVAASSADCDSLVRCAPPQICHPGVAMHGNTIDSVPLISAPALPPAGTGTRRQDPQHPRAPAASGAPARAPLPLQRALRRPPPHCRAGDRLRGGASRGHVGAPARRDGHLSAQAAPFGGGGAARGRAAAPRIPLCGGAWRCGPRDDAGEPVPPPTAPPAHGVRVGAPRPPARLCRLSAPADAELQVHYAPVLINVAQARPDTQRTPRGRRRRAALASWPRRL